MSRILPTLLAGLIAAIFGCSDPEVNDRCLSGEASLQDCCETAPDQYADFCCESDPETYANLCEVANNENNVNTSCEPACSGETSVCVDGACVECVEGGDCESGVCDEATNTCTGCVDNDSCSGVTPRCEAGMCVACDTASDEGCEGETPFCETFAGDAVCVACDTPGSTANCPADTTCTDAYVCSACESNDGCTEADASVCDAPGTEAAECVACQQASDCSLIPGAKQCDDGTCVACTEDTSAMDCTAADASVCDTSGAEPVCVGCSDVSDCGGIGGASHCIESICVECRIESEAADCDGNRCDDNTCTNTPVGTTFGCQECSADADCVGGHRCIPLDYEGSFHGNYCMPVAGPAGQPGRCSGPYGAGVSNRTTVDGQVIDVCVIDEALTTCEAINVYKDNCTLGTGPLAGECEVDGVTAPGARCELVGQIPSCTYTCTGFRDCKLGADCFGSPGNEYCGGP